MSEIFFYPRGLTSHSRELVRFETPPSHVGPIAGKRLSSLGEALESRMERFSNSRQVGSLGTVEIDLTRDGTRQVVTGRRIWQTSIYPSRKSGSAIVCEGANEQLFVQQCEADAGVQEIASQPALFTVRVDGRSQKYHADFARLLCDGTVEIVEIKPDAGYLRKPAYSEKLEAVKALCRAIGWQFRTFFGEDLRRRTFFNFHVGQIQMYRFLRLRQSLEDAILVRLHKSTEPVTIGKIVELSGSLPEARAAMSALICRSKIYTDMTRRLTSEAMVHLVNGRGA